MRTRCGSWHKYAQSPLAEVAAGTQSERGHIVAPAQRISDPPEADYRRSEVPI